jgi:farnesyl diphosphate synthase
LDSPDDILQRYRQRAEDALARCLPADTTRPTRLHAAMRYATLGGGKRVRACLVYATGDALGAAPAILDAPACAIELIHAYSLVHDDLPCMDNDDLRRGQPTCHRAYDEATALLAGDALQTLAFELLSAPQPGLDPRRQLRMMHALATASGAAGMVGGQATDLAAVGQRLELAALEDMHRRKTGALIEAAVRLGVEAAPAVDGDIACDLERYAAALGLAFQIVDDILDVEGDTTTLGKTSGADQARDKPTYPAIMGLAPAKAKAAELHACALASIRCLGDNGRVLAYLADYTLRRTH